MNPELQNRMREAAEKAEVERTVFEGRYPKLLDRLEPLRDKAPKIRVRPVPTVEDMCTSEGVELTELIEKFRSDFSAFVKQLGEHFTVKDDRMPLFEKIFAFYTATKKRNAKSPESVALDVFRSRETFNESFCPEATPYEHSWINRYIEFYLERYVHPERVVYATTRLVGEGGDWGIHDADGDWVMMPEESAWTHGFTFADRSVVEAAGQLAGTGYDRPEFAHTTSSCALDGIGRHNAILSALALLRRGESPTTGEYISQVSKEGSHFDMLSADEGFGRGLGNVYASRGERYSGYQVLQWFDEYRVSFGIDRKKQEEFLTKKNRSREFGQSISDYGSEGFLLGDEATLDAVNLIVVPVRHLEEAKAWGKEHCPHAAVRPAEVLELLHEKGETLNRVALEEGISPKEAWEKLAELSKRKK